PFSSLGVGMTVEARGERALNGTITATRIRVEDDGDGGGDEAVLAFCTSNIDLNSGDIFNIRDYVQVQDNPSQPIDWQQVFFTYTEAGANNPTNPPDWNLSAFNAGQNVTIIEADGAPGTGNEGQGRYQIYIVREGQSQFDDDLTFRVDDERDSEVEEAKCAGSTSAAKQQTSSELLGTARAAFAAVTVDADVIFLGGFNRGPLNLAQRLDSIGVVTSLAPLPSARGSLSAAAIADTIYAIGGRDGTDRVLADVQRMVLSVGTWEPMPRLITAREGSATAAFEGALFVFGGRDPNGRVLGSVETFGDLNTGLEQPDAPSDFVLAPNYPNPFSNSTTISFSLSTEAAGRPVRLTVFDVRGRQIATLVDGVLAPGLHQVSWNGLGLDSMRMGSGIYFYRLQQGDFTARQMMAIIR
ncbi:MAG TPA: T9SS type A sorting domain-containing protein, partial [Rhodothermales bacterium]|nr:T9SS type A sorting domain-containing protein [Rhodothermales bacterium]